MSRLAGGRTMNGFPTRPRPGVRTGPRTRRGRRTAGRARPSRSLDGLRLRDVEWTPVLIGFLVYTFAVISYRFPLGTPGMLIALVALPFQRQAWRFTSLIVWLGAFVVWAQISANVSPYPHAIGDAVVSMAKVWAVVFVGLNALRSRRQIQFFMVFVAALYGAFPARGAIINFLVGYQVFGRAIWNFIYANPNDLAALLLLQVGIAAAIFTTERNRLFRLGAGFALAVFPIVILMTQSRGGLFALGVFAIMALAGRGKKLRRLSYVAVLATAVILIAPDDVWERAQGVVTIRSTEEIAAADPEGSAISRFDILKVATRIVSEHPLTGVGLGAYPEAHDRYAAEMSVSRGAQGHKDTHNTFLNIAAETGVPGLLLLLGLLVTVFMRAERVRRRLRRVEPKEAAALWYLEVGFISYMAAGLFGSFGRLSHFYVYLTLIFALTLALEKKLAQLSAAGPARMRPARSAGRVGTPVQAR